MKNGTGSHTKRINRHVGKLSKLALAICFSATAVTATAGQTFQLGDSGDSSLTVGFGLRTDFTSLQDGAPNGTSASNTFAVDDSRLYINGQLNNIVKGTFNTERDAAGNVVLMDGITQFEFNDNFNIWLGRLLPPSDRSNLDGPFYLNVWQFPIVSQYPNVAIGRDNGVVIWGKPFAQKIVYSVGAFGGHNVGNGDSDASDSLLYAGRLAINFLDPEPAPAYYTGSTYYGSKNILTLGIVFQYQQDGVGNSPATAGTYSSGNLDLLFEKMLDGGGVATIEGAAYDYHLGAVDCGTTEPGSQPCTTTGADIGGLVDGKAYLGTLEYMFADPVNLGGLSGKFQPYVRFQQFNRTLSQTTEKQSDLGVNYIINGPNARLTAVYSRLSDSQLVGNLANRNQFIFGVQYQY